MEVPTPGGEESEALHPTTPENRVNGEVIHPTLTEHKVSKYY